MLISALKLSLNFWGLGTHKNYKAWIFRFLRQIQSPDFQFLRLLLGLATKLIKSRVLDFISVPNTNHVCNTYMSEQSSPRDVFQTYPARKSDSIKISPVKNYFNYFKPFSDVSTELQLLTIQMIPSSNCSNTKPSGEKLQVASALWQPLNSVVFFFNEENIWAKTTGGSLQITPQTTPGDCKNTTPAMGILQSTRAFQCDSNPMVFSQVIKQRSCCFNLT